MAIQDDNTILSKGDLKAYHQKILPYLGGNMMMSTNVSDHYSTDEKVVGVWTDGKPLYQKTIVKNNTRITEITAHGIPDIENIAKVEILFNNRGVFQHSTNALIYNNPSDGIGFAVTVDATNIYIKNVEGAGTSWDADTNRTWYFILNYTKTTDAAGSGTTTPGAYDINFPNTWKANTEIYFGNGLYGYRAKGTCSIAQGNSADVTYVPATAGTRIRGYGGYFGNSNANTSLGPFYADTSSALISGNWNKGSSNNLNLRFINISWGAAIITEYDVWVTYTK